VSATADREEFTRRFGRVAEGSPWVAEVAWERGPFADRAAMAEAFDEDHCAHELRWLASTEPSPTFVVPVH